ncbi:hypothetical protein K0T92_19735 [Paenibacillus oenotherae]|uniref:Uncharacterized protein n=1 Tax=Paenibacillus oenotherae TaxID=1435645 RepID=A0ABS7DB26_9BACL|nr:hypothetical protein [Paenibacillus oenotherae]MBW7476953.1 hypothetical protein [Paenibacillus oenotherae]
MNHWIRELNARDRLLAMTGYIHLVLAVVFAVLILLDSRLMLGINIWLKPTKFALSIAVYAFSVAAIMKYVSSAKVRKAVSYISTVGLFIETIIIAVQAARGEHSHFNFTSPLNLTLFIIMGVFIGAVTVAGIILFVHLIRHKLDMPAYMALALRTGLFISLIGSGIGGYMSKYNKHTVGGDDGGEGLFLINWSTVVGDLRVSHFFGLHALQIIPLLAFVIAGKLASSTAQKAVVWVISILYGGYVIWTFVQSANGTPFIAK